MSAENTPATPLENTDDFTLKMMERAGWALCAGWAATLIAWAIFEPDPYAQGWRLVLELMFVGRLVSIADGVGNGFSSTYLLAQNIPQDMILLLVALPWVVRAYQFGVRNTFIGNRIDTLRKTAERNKRIVEPFGVVGLWAFVFFPFWSTGALVGGVVGYLLGMRYPLILSTIFLAHCLSVVSVLMFMDAMKDIAESFDSGIAKFFPWIILGLLILITLIYRALKTLRDRNKSHGTSE